MRGMLPAFLISGVHMKCLILLFEEALIFQWDVLSEVHSVVIPSLIIFLISHDSIFPVVLI